MTDYLTSLIRTYVPLAWGTVLTWLVTAGIIDEATAADAAPVAPMVLVPIATGAIYALARAVEPHLPRWLVVVLLGSPRQPSYDAES